MRRVPDNTTALAMAEERWVTPATASALLGRPERTLRTWAREQLVAVRWYDGVMYVSLEDVAAQSTTRPRRRRLPCAPPSP